MTTVGYGDVVASTKYGRIISMFCALWGSFIISLLVSAIVKVFELSDN
jgi:Ion channel